MITENLIEVLDNIKEKTPFSNIYLQNLLPVEKNKPVSFTAFSINGEIKIVLDGSENKGTSVAILVQLHTAGVYINLN